MAAPHQEGFKTLLEEEREKRPISKTPQGVDKRWWKRELGYNFSCPHVAGHICGLSEKFRPAGAFICSGSWHQTCEIFLLVKNNNDDPSVLIHE